MVRVEHRDRLFRSVIREAVTAPLSIFLSASGVLLVPSHLWWLGLGALGAEGLYLWMRIRDPEQARLSQDALQERHWRELIRRVEEAMTRSDAEMGRVLAGILESQDRLVAVYGGNHSVGAPIRRELVGLLEKCLSLGERRDEIRGYLASFHPVEVQREVYELELRTERTGDAVARGLLEQALDQKRRELTNFTRLEEAVARIDSQLVAVRCTFDNMVSVVVRMRNGEPAAADAEQDPVFTELGDLARNVAAMEATLAETLTLRGRAG